MVNLKNITKSLDDVVVKIKEGVSQVTQDLYFAREGYKPIPINYAQRGDTIDESQREMLAKGYDSGLLCTY
ncbi:hypothetical protein GOV06_04950 [Candidatus Woesearchaeota archaeon]|nr:hypothetical protein [Candidatus Woesearchaeota archaeon]